MKQLDHSWECKGILTVILTHPSHGSGAFIVWTHHLQPTFPPGSGCGPMRQAVNRLLVLREISRINQYIDRVIVLEISTMTKNMCKDLLPEYLSGSLVKFSILRAASIESFEQKNMVRFGCTTKTGRMEVEGIEPNSS